MATNPCIPNRVHPGKICHVADPDLNRYQIGFTASKLGQHRVNLRQNFAGLNGDVSGQAVRNLPGKIHVSPTVKASLIRGPGFSRVRFICSPLGSVIVGRGASGTASGGIRCGNSRSKGNGAKPVHGYKPPNAAPLNIRLKHDRSRSKLVEPRGFEPLTSTLPV